MKRFDERRIEDGEAIEYEPDCKKQIQKGGKNNPPAVEDTRKQAIGHHANQSRSQGWHREDRDDPGAPSPLGTFWSGSGKTGSSSRPEDQAPGMIVFHNVDKDNVTSRGMRPSVENLPVKSINALGKSCPYRADFDETPKSLVPRLAKYSFS